MTGRSSQRIVSVDALRGFDMIMILGVDGIVGRLHEYARDTPWLARLVPALAFLHTEFSHKDWEGMAFEDLIFPLFVFIVGVSIVLSLGRSRDAGLSIPLVGRILLRTAVLYLLGLLVYHGFDQPLTAFSGQDGSHHAVRWLGVLQRIAICYGVTALLFLLLRTRGLIVAAVVLLVGYWALMTFVPVPGAGRGSFVESANLANYIDQHYLGGYKWDGDHDPEGLLSTLPAIATCLLGVFAGSIVREQKLSPPAKTAMLIGGGAVLALAGYAWGTLPSPVHFPIIKKLWTSSYVLLAGGLSAALLGFFYLIIDVANFRVWAVPFTWIGANAITLYLLTEFGFTRRLAELLVGGGDHDWPLFGNAQPLITASVSLAVSIAVARFLYRRNVFVRV